MSTLDPQRLRETLGQPALSRLLGLLRKRLEKGDPLPAQMTLSRPQSAEREAVYRLFGSRPARPTHQLRVSLVQLAEVLRQAEICSSLEQAVVELTGPLQSPDRHLNSRWLQAEAEFLQQVPLLDCLIRSAPGRTYLRRLCHGRPERLAELSRVLPALQARLPESGLSLAELAAQLCGDSHAFDRGRAQGSLALKLAAAAYGYDPLDRRLGRRTIWAAVGVLCDELSTPALTLNLPATGDSFTDQALRLHAHHGQPYRLSLRQLLRQPPQIQCSRVYLCENPAIVAAAVDRLGSRSAPLLCSEGQPRSAFTALCNQLADHNVELYYHGDFDWPGIRIANLLMERHRVRPWRFQTGDYINAQHRGGRLNGLPATASWDPDLRATMLQYGRCVHEEQVMTELLSDLNLRS